MDIKDLSFRELMVETALLNGWKISMSGNDEPINGIIFNIEWAKKFFGKDKYKKNLKKLAIMENRERREYLKDFINEAGIINKFKNYK